MHHSSPFVRVACACCSTYALIGGEAPAQSCPPLVLEELAARGFIYSVSGAGDLDRDGYDDFLAVLGPLSAYDELDAISGRSGVVLWRFALTAYSFGTLTVAPAGDLDGDGVSEVLFGVDDLAASAPLAGGVVFVLNGSNGALMRRLEGATSVQRFGSSVAAAGDFDRDGVSDAICGAPWTDLPGGLYNRGAVLVHSGRTGQLLLRIDGLASSGSFGSCVAGGRDLNRNGRPDLVVSDPYRIPYGVVEAYEGSNGNLLWTFASPVQDWFPGSDPRSVDILDDLNGDGIPEVLVGIDGFGARTSTPGCAHVLSGSDGRSIGVIAGQTPGAEFGNSVARIDDVDSDGKADILIGAPWERPGGLVAAGSAYVYSSTSLSLLSRFDGDRRFPRIGEHVASCGDLNDDDLPDILVGGALDGVVALQVAPMRLYGKGLAGTLGVPRLSVAVAPQQGVVAMLRASNSQGFATPGILLLGRARQSSPAFGGDLLVSLDVELSVLVSSFGSIVASIPVRRDPVLICGRVFCQIVELDPGAVAGVSMSRGLELAILP